MTGREHQAEQNKSVILKEGNNPPRKLDHEQTVRLMQLQQQKIRDLTEENTKLKEIIKEIQKNDTLANNS